MASIAEQRVPGRHGIDGVATTAAVLLGLSSLLVLYQAYASLSLPKMVAGLILLLAALVAFAAGWRDSRRSSGVSSGKDVQFHSLLDAHVENLAAQRTAQARDLIAHIEACREQEKKAIARQLHGELGSSLTALSLHMSMLSRQLPDTPPPVQERLREMKALLASAAEATRQIQSGLRPEKLELFGLNAAMEELAHSVSQTSGIAVELHLPEEDISLSPQLALALYRMLEAVLDNVTQHAYATRVQILMEEQQGGLTLLVCDNGVGFDPHEIQSGAYGLYSLRERTAYLGGRADIQSSPGKGTQVSIWLPLQQQADGLLRVA